MESRHSVQSTSVSYGGIGEIQKDVPNSRHEHTFVHTESVQEYVAIE